MAEASRIHIAGGVLVIIFNLLACVMAGAQSGYYSITKLADSTGPLKSFSRPSINKGGTVVFTADLDNGGQVIYSRPDGGGVAAVVDTAGGIYSSFGSAFTTFPVINAGGTVVFNASLSAGGSGIFASTGPGQAPTTVATTGSMFSGFGLRASINSMGTLAFSASLTGTSTQGLYTAGTNGSGLTPVILSGGTLGLTGFNPPSINTNGIVAFGSSTFTTPGIYASAAGGSTLTVATATGNFTDFGGSLAMNDAGKIVFRGNLSSAGSGIFAGDSSGGPVTTVALSGTAFGGFNGFVSINGIGTVAFQAALRSGGGGVFTGPDPIANRVIGFPDALFGSTVNFADIGTQSINDGGQVAFSYSLANGVGGIALATPVLPITVQLGSVSLAGSAGKMAIRLTATQGGSYFLERSVDLVRWEIAGEVLLTGPGLIEFNESQLPVSPIPATGSIFYRIGRRQ